MQTNARSSSCARNLETFSSEMSNRWQRKWRLHTDQVKLRFIGLGNMGSRIAERLLDRGYQVAVYDLDPGREAAEHGGRVAKSIS
jgi:phosphoglycerate dehydrogenase-like enzyme